MKKETAKKKGLIAEILATLFIMYFAYGTIMSVLRIQSLENLLTFYTYNHVAVAWIIIIGQALTLTLILNRKTRALGYLLSLVYSVCFGLTLWLWPHLPHDFEGMLNYMSKSQHQVFAIGSIVLSLLGLLLNLKIHKKPVQVEETPVVFT